MSGWDRGDVFVANPTKSLANQEQLQDSDYQLEVIAFKFLCEFRIDNTFIYRELIRRNVLSNCTWITLYLEHISTYNELLTTHFLRNPARIIKMVFTMFFSR